jgi:hypothetical protein
MRSEGSSDRIRIDFDKVDIEKLKWLCTARASGNVSVCPLFLGGNMHTSRKEGVGFV